MLFLTHLLFGMLASLVFTDYFPYERLAFVPIAAFFAVFPDIDTMKSKISRRLPVFGFVSWLLFGHRGLFHSLLFPAMAYILVLPFSDLAATAIVLGYISHLAADALTPKGIAFFYPIPVKVKGPIKTGSLLEKLLAFLLLIALVVYYLSA